MFFICTLNASKVVFVTFNLNCRLHAVSVEKPSAQMSNFWTVRIFISKQNFGFPHTTNVVLSFTDCSTASLAILQDWLPHCSFCYAAVHPQSGTLWDRFQKLLFDSFQIHSSHPWPSFCKGENKGSVLLWHSCFDRYVLMFLTREGLQCRICILKHCLMRLWNNINQLTFVFPFAEIRSIKRMWRQLTKRILARKVLDLTFFH